MNSIPLMNRAADNIRILAAAMVEKAKSGHPGGAMGGADFINVLFSEYLQFDPKNPTWEGRDRFFLDPGHMAPMLYAELTLTGKFTLDEIQQLRQWGSPTPGHPEVCYERGIENSSGPLGQGHAYAVGAAIAAKFLYAKTGNPTFGKETVYTYISDGGIQEEVSLGAARIAGNLGLDNLIMFYDSNDIQLSTETSVVTCEDVAMRYRALGWEVYDINGNDVEQIRQALDKAKAVEGKPTLIIGHCIMGKGARKEDGSSYERNCKTHGAPLGGDAFRNTITNLGGNPDEPFVIFPEVADLYEARLKELEGIAAIRHEEEEAWAKQNNEKAAQLKDWFCGKLPQIDWKSIEQKPNDATRNASSACLALLAKQVPNMIVSSADLCNSDKTDGFLKGGATVISRDNYGGNFLQAGVAELTMACCCIGIMLHGGAIAACGTFFVFSDYMKPAIRMAALMQVPVKFIWTHDAFRVGEDGPTHEPVEQEAQIRLMEKLKNHSGKNSVLVLRPADAKETTTAWAMAMENTETPTALILSRQNIENLPEGNDYEQARKGGYIVAGSDENPDVVLVATGSEVSTLVAGASLLRQDGYKVRIVDVPSEGLFREQPVAYQKSVVPEGAKVFGLTAGLPVNLQSFLIGADPRSTVWGLNSFGFSAPYKVLDEKLGFTAENVYNQAINILNEQ
ncbi:MAG: transketolase [Bacteroidaceae bacterium]|nr:transketolase [Bacteroidaceae bacterium]